MKRVGRILAVFAVLIVIGVAGLTLWGKDAYAPQQPALDALQSNGEVTVTVRDDYIFFEPVGDRSTTGFVFYPGGRVDYRAYSPVLSQIASHGYFVAVVKVRINLAFFDLNAADRAISNRPDIRHWIVGGHSLGGVASAIYASRHPAVVDGLVFWASYPADDSLATTDLQVLSIYGSNDMAGTEPFESSRSQLPDTTKFLVIEGGNHSQFGSYGLQAGDTPATISPEEQWDQVAEATVQFLATWNE